MVCCSTSARTNSAKDSPDGNRIAAGCLQRAVAPHQGDGVIQIAVALIALFDGARPEGAFFGVGSERWDWRMNTMGGQAQDWFDYMRSYYD